MTSQPKLARQLGLFDATMVVMGGIVGAGIFINPYVVARQVHTPALILGAWIFGGVIALAAAFIWAELAATLPNVGGDYAYLREAFHPIAAFLYGWVLLLVVQTGGAAAVSITFARYFLVLTGMHAPDWLIATSAMAVLTFINCLGVKVGGRTQSVLMVLKIGAIGMLVVFGIAFAGRSSETVIADSAASLGSFGAAMIPVVFAYGGWQTSTFVAAEVKEPEKNLPRGLVMGVLGVIALYTAVNWICVRSLGAQGLADTMTPATSVMRLALGDKGATFIAAAIAISTLGFLSNSILTGPRVYFAMAEDGVFFRSVAWVHPVTRVPVLAIVLQSVWTIVIALSGKYEQILNYVVSMNFVFFGLTAACIFVFRARRKSGAWKGDIAHPVPGHPWTTAAFIAVCAWVVWVTIVQYPQNSLIGVALAAAGVPVYWMWKRKARNVKA